MKAQYGADEELKTETQAGSWAAEAARMAQTVKIPRQMQAAVYRGVDQIVLETVPVPEIGPGELLVRVHTCGICGTDLKKVSSGSHSAPRIFGHETAGVIVAVGAGRSGYEVGERVVVFHHMPCRSCFYCRKKMFSQCATYKVVGCTAGFEPSGGGFSEYVRVMNSIIDLGAVVKIPDEVSYEQASFIEPVNTCMKGIEALRLEPDETVLVIGQGPIGIMLSLLARDTGAQVITSDLFPDRLTIAKSFGLRAEIDASRVDCIAAIQDVTEGRGADVVILAVGGSGLIRTAMDAARSGGRVLLFAQTARGEAVIDPAAVCVDEKTLLGSYSASVDLQAETVDYVFRREANLERLVSHRFPLSDCVEAMRRAAQAGPETMKLVIQPGSAWEG